MVKIEEIVATILSHQANENEHLIIMNRELFEALKLAHDELYKSHKIKAPPLDETMARVHGLRLIVTNSTFIKTYKLVKEI